jgi:hypothetical protein
MLKFVLGARGGRSNRPAPTKSIMQLILPDIGDLLVVIALLFTALILLFETLQTRRDGQREQRMLDAIDEEYRAFRRLGRL